MTGHYDPGDPEIRNNPYPTYERLRRDEPVHWSPPLQSWVLTRYDHVKRVSLDRRFSADRLRSFFARQTAEQRARIPDLIRYLTEWLVFRDPPSHTRLRKLVNKAFTPRAIRRRRPRMEAICSELLNSLSDTGEIDLIADFAGPLPALVIMDLIGVPAEHAENFKTLVRRRRTLRR